MEIVVDLEVVRKKEGDILKVYCRKDFSTQLIEKNLKEVPIIFKAKNEEKLRQINANYMKIKNNVYLLRSTPHDARTIIKKLGIDISINEFLSFKCPKFSLIERIDDKLKINEGSLEDKIKYFEKEKYVALDIENFSFNEELYCLGLLYGDKAKVYHTLAFDKERIEDYEIIKVENEKEIIKRFLKEMQDYDPYFVVLHWGQHDLRILQKLGFKLVRFRGKKQEAKKGRPTKVKLLGKNIVDTCLMARAFFPELPNFKLETLAKYFLDKEIKKYGIEELDEMAKKAKEDCSIAEELIKYNINDLIVTKQIFEIFRKPLIKLSLSFKRNIEDIILGEKIENSFNIFRQKKANMLYKHNPFGDFLIFTKKEQEFLSKTDFNKLKRKTIDYILDENYKQGFYDCVVVYPLFLQRIFSPLLINEEILRFFEKSKEMEKALFAKSIDSFLAYPFFEYHFIKKKRQNLNKLNKWYEYTFSLNLNQIDREIQKIKKDFSDISDSIINYGKYIFIDSNLLENYYLNKKFEEMKKKNLFYVVKKGKCYSIDKGKIVYYADGKLFDEGIELSKKIPTRFKAINSILTEFFYNLFEKGTTYAIKYVFEIGKKIKNKEIDIEDLAFEGVINREPYEYINKTFKSKISQTEKGKYKVWFSKDGFTDKKEGIDFDKYVKYFVELFDPILVPLYNNWRKDFLGQLNLF